MANKISPMLAKVSHEIFSGKEWIFERKLDGERCIAIKNGKKINLYSRYHKKINVSYPEIEQTLKKQRKDFIIDGEIVAFEKGLTSFSKLQPRMHLKSSEKAIKTGVQVYYYVFDILESENKNTKGKSLIERKKILRNTLSFNNKIRFLEYKKTDGKKLYKSVCKKGWEGLIAKKIDSKYKTGSRSSDWLKLKCENEQEFVVGGFTEPQGKRKGFGALLLGYHKGKKLKYAGEVGTGQGFTENFLKQLSNKLKRIEKKSSPFTEAIKTKNVHWTKPAMVVQIAFTEWTKDGKLRHPRFLGLRRGKKSKDVIKEG